MYGKVLVLLMVAFCLTEVLDNKIRPLAFQVRKNDKKTEKERMKEKIRKKDI